MFYTSLNLRRTRHVIRAIIGRLALVTHQFGSALRTMGDKFHRTCFDRALRDVYTHYLRYDLTTLFDIHIIANMKIELTYGVFIINRCTFHHRASKLHWIHIRHRSNGTGTSHLKCYPVEASALTLSLKLICNSPSRTLGRISESTLLTQRVYLKHNTVGSHR